MNLAQKKYFAASVVTVEPVSLTPQWHKSFILEAQEIGDYELEIPFFLIQSDKKNSVVGFCQGDDFLDPPNKLLFMLTVLNSNDDESVKVSFSMKRNLKFHHRSVFLTQFYLGYTKTIQEEVFEMEQDREDESDEVDDDTMFEMQKQHEKEVVERRDMKLSEASLARLGKPTESRVTEFLHNQKDILNVETKYFVQPEGFGDLGVIAERQALQDTMNCMSKFNVAAEPKSFLCDWCLEKKDLNKAVQCVSVCVDCASQAMEKYFDPINEKLGRCKSCNLFSGNLWPPHKICTACWQLDVRASRRGHTLKCEECQLVHQIEMFSPTSRTLLLPCCVSCESRHTPLEW